VVPVVVPNFASGTTLVYDIDSKRLIELHKWFPWWFPKLGREPLVQIVQKSKRSGTTGNHLGEPLVQACFHALKRNAHVLKGGTAISRYGVEGDRRLGRI
jgi:hypothetical protein